MPDTDIEEYLRNSIDLQWLSSDEDLIHFMQTFIEEHQWKKRVERMNGDAAPELALLDARNLIQLPGFQDMDPQRKELLRSKFQHILDRPTSIRLVQGSHLDELQFRVSSGGKYNAHRQALPFK